MPSDNPQFMTGYDQQSQKNTQVDWTKSLVAVKCEEYANHIEVERREHDAVLRFYVKSWPGQVPSGQSRDKLVRAITVPLGTLEALES